MSNLFSGSRHVMDWLGTKPAGFVFTSKDVPDWPVDRGTGAISGFLNKAASAGAVEPMTKGRQGLFTYRLVDPGFEMMPNAGRKQPTGGSVPGRACPKKNVRVLPRQITEDHRFDQQTEEARVACEVKTCAIPQDYLQVLLECLPEGMLWAELIRRETNK